MVTAADATTIMSRKNAACGNCDSFSQGDVDLLDEGSSYYVWETGGQPWNQLAILMDGATPVAFDPPLQLSFVVPTGAKYGSYEGATISLQYGGFGDLWGIPNECVDITTNATCDFTPGTGTAQNNQRWTSLFSIPFDAATGHVTATIAQGSVAQGTRYLVKPLDMEVRLANVTGNTPNPCTAASLSAPAINLAALPGASSFQDPQPLTGTKPTFATAPAPQVIHGVKQY